MPGIAERFDRGMPFGMTSKDGAKEAIGETSQVLESVTSQLTDGASRTVNGFVEHENVAPSLQAAPDAIKAGTDLANAATAAITPAAPAVALGKVAISMAASHGPSLLATPETTKLARTGLSHLADIASSLNTMIKSDKSRMMRSELNSTRNEMPAHALNMLLSRHAKQPDSL